MISFIEGSRNTKPPVHPGKTLLDDLVELNLAPAAFAVNGKQAITAETALRFERYLGTSAVFWMNLQKTYELQVAEIELGEQITHQIVRRPTAA